MFPKTEKELEIYFKLLELIEMKRKADLPYSLTYPHTEMYENNYKKCKDEYLKLANE